MRLEFPSVERIPIHLGVIGPKMLELSGEIADGSVLSVLAGTDYIGWARQRIDAGRKRTGRIDNHHVTAFAIYSVDPSASRAMAAAESTLAFYLAAGGRNALTDAAGISERLPEILSQPPSVMARELVDALTIAGTPDEVSEKIHRLIDAGADSVALFPTPPERAEEIIDLTARFGVASSLTAAVHHPRSVPAIGRSVEFPCPLPIRRSKPSSSGPAARIKFGVLSKSRCKASDAASRSSSAIASRMRPWRSRPSSMKVPSLATRRR